eukprot:8479140-Alexandrium_andersonii.AAC.1
MLVCCCPASPPRLLHSLLRGREGMPANLSKARRASYKACACNAPTHARPTQAPGEAKRRV